MNDGPIIGPDRSNNSQNKTRKPAFTQVWPSERARAPAHAGHTNRSSMLLVLTDWVEVVEAAAALAPRLSTAAGAAERAPPP